MRYIGITILFLFISILALSQNQRIGDVIINPDGSKGIVFWIHPDGSGGWMVALYNLPRYYTWGERIDIPDVPNVGENASYNDVPIIALSDTAGYSNTKKIREYYGTADTIYAAQVVDFENGWYIPALGQLRKLHAAYSSVMPVILANGGNDFMESTSTVNYWSSTEQDRFSSFAVAVSYGPTSSLPKSFSCYVRPVRSFTSQGIVYDTTLTYQWNTGDTEPHITPAPSRTTTYSVVATSTTGCTSRASQQIFMASGNTDTIRASIRRGETYIRNGFNVSEPGTYTRTLDGANGCNSSVVLVLTVLEPVNTELHDSFCDGSPYQKYNFTQWNPGTYTQRWTAANGCDSTVTLHLTSHPSYHKTYNATIFSGETHTEHGFNVSTPGTHHLRLQTADGCDSVFTVNLKVTSDYHITIDASICEGESYSENNFNENRTGTYTKRLKSIMGHDSIVTLHLTVNPTYHTAFNGALCPGKTYTEHGFNVSVPGVYHRDLQTASGCDSTITLNLSTAPICHEVIDATICEGEIYAQNGFNETRPGTHYLRLHSASGCDSVITLNLSVTPSYYFERIVTICQGESYDFKGTLLHETGIYYHNLQTITGCDSIYELDLTVKPAYHKQINALICEGTSYTDHGFNVSVPGIHIRRAASANGCDSVFTLQLEVEGIEGSISIDLMDCTTHEYGFRFDNRADVPVAGYTWDFGDGTVSTEEAPAHRYAKERSYPVNLVITTGNGCQTTVSHPVNVPYYLNPIPIYASRKGINNEDGLITFRTDPIEGLECKWDLGDGTFADGYAVEHRYDAEAQEYYNVRLTANNSDDCLMEQEFQLKSFKVVHPPNTFSPNGDGINDIFMKGCRVQILNRNGVVIFKGEDGWDGTRKGEQATEDTYFYELDYMTEEGEKMKKGYITLIR